MDASDLLKVAQRDLKAMRYRQVIRNLEPKILLFSNDAHFYYLLGAACYFTGDVQGTQLYLHKGLACAEEDINMRLLLACAALRRRDTASAVQLWLEVDDLMPDHKIARYGLKKLKTIGDSRDLSRFIASSAFQKLLPIRPLAPAARATLALLYLLLVILLLLSVGFLSLRIFRQVVPTPTWTREGVPSDFTFFEAPPEMLSISDMPTHITLSAAEVEQAMQSARNYFNDFQDDLAGRELNRILLSNASGAAKNQALLLKEAFRAPTFATYTAGFSYADVASDPSLYHGLHVLWRGPINGLNITPARIAFRLLVGYDAGQVLDGAVEVSVPFEVYLDPNLITNVLGKVIADAYGNFYLQAVSLNQVVPLN